MMIGNELSILFNILGQPSKVSFGLLIVTTILSYYYKDLSKKHKSIMNLLHKLQHKIDELEKQINRGGLP